MPKKRTKKAPSTDTGSPLRRTERGERTTVYLLPELAARLRAYCERERCSLTHAVSEAVEAMLDGAEGER